ncbi:type VII secretion protein EssC [uncultured Vagococcus sp.]|uniref:type VII secretion protein EssC n=1 Tax=uncultured Vagococcus sp. TaxID=189676 RepID=UPI0037DDBBA8
MILTLYLDGYRYQKHLEPGNTYQLAHDILVTVGNQETLSDWALSYEDGWVLRSEDQTLTLSEGQQDFPALGDVAIWLTPAAPLEIYDTLGKTELRIGTDKGADLTVTADIQVVLTQVERGWQVTNLGGPLYHNNSLVASADFLLEMGDELAVGSQLIKVFEKELLISSHLVTHNSLSQIFTSRYITYADYPDFHRSPRIIYREPEGEKAVNPPPEEIKKPTDQLLKTLIPPVIMFIMTLVMAFIMKRGIMVIATAATTLVTIVFSITSFIKTRRDYKQDVIDRRESYELYLTLKSIEMHELNEEQKAGQLYHYPSIEELTVLAKTYNHRIYEKTPLHFDFLYYRLGLGDVATSSKIKYSNAEREKKGDDLEERGFELYQKSLTITGMPSTANLMNGPVGYIGPRPLVIEQLQLLVNQLAMFHSYHDLQLVTIFPEEELPEWEWMRWLPHASLQEMNVRGFVYNQRSRDQVLNSLNQILKNRQNTLNEEKNKRDSTIFSPHYVVMVTDEKLILDHVIMEFFTEDPSELGCSVIFVQDVMSSLSENVKTVIDIRDRNTGVLVLEEGNLKSDTFELDHFPVDCDKEELPRLLAPLNHLQNLKSSIPETVTFMELYGVERFEELNVLSRWAEHSPHKSLAVPLGLRGKDDIVNLNLHEKAHGPHGLVAGTTGSGKSEIVQSYIISLAVNFHPYDVAFLLIDYKGGGMANLFRDLPHLLGTITNLDGAQSMRALISINAELKRRQRLFSENDVNHINQYQKLYKSGDVKEPMPHLFLISDEFAELKSEQPEFMAELVSTARIGRSLGIHLILATQKPSGVVDDQIWSNSKFKLALKVADRSDSMEMLKTADAAEITQPGRAYLQVGNNEIYELFQSAWSGADYQPDKDDQQIEDHTIYRINDLGQYEILSEDLSGLEDVEDVKQIPTELDAVVQGIKVIVEEQAIETLPSPWLPPLPERVYLPDLQDLNYQANWQGEKQPLVPVLGTIDLPSRQAQETLAIDLSKDGHLAVYSSPGYGKSSFIQTIVMGLARIHNPERLHVYLLDFGTNGLLPLRALPHTADSMTVDDEEKIGKFVRRMEAEVKRRKKLLSEYAVASLSMYEKASGNEEPIIFLPVDGYEGIKGNKFEEILEKMITSIAREGAAVGIHLLISAGRQSAMRVQLQGNIKVQIPLKLNDDSEPRSVVGRTDLIIEDMPGRGLFKTEDGAQSIQVALPNRGEDPLEIIEGIRQEAQEMAEYWSGELPEEIPMVPEVLYFDEFRKKKQVREQVEMGALPLGVDFEEVSSVPFDLNYCGNLAVFGEQPRTLFLLKKSILRGISLMDSNIDTMIIDNDKLLEHVPGEFNASIVNEELFSEVKEDLLFEIQKRQNADAQTLNKWLVYITNMEVFEKKALLTEEEFLTLINAGTEVGIHFVIAGDHQYMAKNRIGLPRLIKDNIKTALFNLKVSDQMYMDKPYNSREPEIEHDAAYFAIDKQFIKVKLMLD